MFASNANACVFRELDAFASSNTFEQTKMPSHIDGFATDCGEISESSLKNCPESVALCSSSSFLWAAVGAFFANWSAWKAMDSFFRSSNSNFILVSQSFSRVEELSTAKRTYIKSEKTNKNAFGTLSLSQTLSLPPQQRDVILYTFVFN